MNKSQTEFDFIKKVFKKVKLFSNIEVIFSKVISSTVFDNIHHMFEQIIEHELKFTS